jgi:hypothetical protein
MFASFKLPSNILYKMAKLAIDHWHKEINSSLGLEGPDLKINCPVDE